MSNSFTSFTPVLSKYNDYKNESVEENYFTSLLSLLSTPKGTHPYDPEYGVNIRTYILQNDNGNLSSIIEQDVKSSIQLYLPDIYPLTTIVVTREYHPSGIGYIYKLNVVVEDMVVRFDVTKQGTLLYKGVI